MRRGAASPALRALEISESKSAHVLTDLSTVEPFFHLTKKELTHHELFDTIDDARRKVLDYIEVLRQSTQAPGTRLSLTG
jgi:hypothetical protein